MADVYPGIPNWWWMFEEDGNAVDGSGKAQTLTRNGATRTTTHHQGTYAANFSAATQNFTRTNANLAADFFIKSATSRFSMGAWVYNTSVTEGVVLSMQNPSSPYTGPNLIVQANHNVRMEFDGISALGASTGVSLSVWHHVACVWSGSSAAVYIDGVPGTSLSTTLSTPLATWGFFIGNQSSGSRQFIGAIDEAFIYKNVALTPSNLTWIINNGLPTYNLSASGVALTSAFGSAPIICPSGF